MAPLGLGILAGPVASASQRRPAPNGLVLSVSDIHFDPFYDRALFRSLVESDVKRWETIFKKSVVNRPSAYGSDTNFPLLDSALNEMRRTVPFPDMIIISGDFLAHDFVSTFAKAFGSSDSRALQMFVDKTIAFLTLMIEQRFPQAPVYPALGNNDSYCGDYAIDPAGLFLKATAQTWKRLFKNQANADSFMQTFPLSGSYSVVAPRNRKHRILVLNTVFFSSEYQNSCGSPQSDPGGDQIKWIESRLKAAASAEEKVWLVYHIPPGVDVYANSKSPAPVLYWKSTYNQQFLEMMKRYSATVVASFAGHTHMDSFELLCQAISRRADGFVDVTPAISPLFDNNPGFKLFAYDRRSASVRDYSAYFLDLKSPGARWTMEYRFGASYRLPEVNAVSLQALQNLMLTDYHGILGRFEKYYNVSNVSKPAITDSNWPGYWCGIGNLTGPQFSQCHKIITEGRTACANSTEIPSQASQEELSLVPGRKRTKVPLTRLPRKCRLATAI